MTRWEVPGTLRWSWSARADLWGPGEWWLLGNLHGASYGSGALWIDDRSAALGLLGAVEAALAAGWCEYQLSAIGGPWTEVTWEPEDVWAR